MFARCHNLSDWCHHRLGQLRYPTTAVWDADLQNLDDMLPSNYHRWGSIFFLPTSG